MTEAWQHAKEIAGLLPRNAQWSFNITDIEDDAVFNIYAPREAWHGLCILLGLPKPEAQYRNYDGRFPSYNEYNVGGLCVSLITPEEQDGRDEPAGTDDPAA